MAYTAHLEDSIRKVRGLLMAFGLENKIRIAFITVFQKNIFGCFNFIIQYVIVNFPRVTIDLLPEVYYNGNHSELCVWRLIYEDRCDGCRHRGGRGCTA